MTTTTNGAPTPAAMPGAGLRPGQRPADAAALADLLADEVRRLTALLEELGGRVDDVESDQAELGRRIEHVERGQRRTTGNADLDEQILTLLRRTGMRMTALVIAENLGDRDANKDVGSRLRSLHGRGEVVADKKDGQTTMWSAPR